MAREAQPKGGTFGINNDEHGALRMTVLVDMDSLERHGVWMWLAMMDRLEEEERLGKKICMWLTDLMVNIAVCSSDFAQ